MPDPVALLIPLWLLACAISDWQSRRVPNTYTYGFLFAAATCLAVQGQTLSGSGWQEGVFGMAVAALLTLPGFALNRLGGGDVKLLAGLGLATGPLAVVVTFVVGTLVLVLGALINRLRPAPGENDAAADFTRREWPFVPGLLVGYLVAMFALPYYLPAG